LYDAVKAPLIDAAVDLRTVDRALTGILPEIHDDSAPTSATNANFDGADLRGADRTFTVGLTTETVYIEDTTKWPEAARGWIKRFPDNPYVQVRLVNGAVKMISDVARAEMA